MYLPPFTHRQRNTVVIGSRGPFGLFPVAIPLGSYNTHLYVVGKSGSGKSKLLQHLLFQLITTGWGCGVIDPHSDLASDLIAQLFATGWLSQPENRQRVIFLDPSRTDYLIPANVLKCSYATAHQTAENILEAFRRVWPETLAEAPRFAQILRNGLMVLIENNLSLAELEPLLTHRDFRTRLLASTTDAEAIAFFRDQYDRWGREQLIFAGSVLNKVSAFLFFPPVRLSLGATENRLDLRQIIDNGTLLIVDLGGLTGETQQLYGSLIVTLLEQAAMSRRDGHTRNPYFCMIDEFPFFCARDVTTLARILSEVRKFKVYLGLAHQTISQLQNERMQGAVENAEVKFIFGTGRQTAEALVKDLFIPDTQSIKHEVKDSQAQERTHPVFDPLLEQFERFTQSIQRLRSRQVLVKLPDRELLKVKTPNVPNPRLSDEQLAQLKTALVRQIGKPYRELEEERKKGGSLHASPITPPPPAHGNF